MRLVLIYPLNSTEAGNSDNNTKVKITTTIDAAIKTQCFTTSVAIAMHNQGTITTPKSRVWGGKSSTKFYVKLDGKSVGKVEIDRGAWGEYSDNPDDVKDWEHTNKVCRSCICIAC